jgi:hypothetical protein
MTAVYENVEIGAGKEACGPRFYSPCLATDIHPLPGISVVTDGRQLALKSAQFSTVIVCNPYKYGFIREAGEALMRELLRVLSPGGTIIVVGKSTNPWCQFDRIRGIAESLPGVSLTVERQAISAAEKFPGHSFSRVDGSPTVPDVEIRVRVRQ